MVQMKALARLHVWWPRIEDDVESCVRSCQNCQAVASNPLVAMHHWSWPRAPWERVHLDFAGPFLGSMFLVVVDAHSKWVEVFRMKTITSLDTFNILHELFAHYGLPRLIISDNGPQLTSWEFQDFIQQNGVHYVYSPVYHPQSNGQAERVVQKVKAGLHKLSDVGEIDLWLAHLLGTLHSTPHSHTGVMPAQLFLGRQLHTHLDLLRPESVPAPCPLVRVPLATPACKPRFDIGCAVWARGYQWAPQWLPGVVSQKLGSMTFLFCLLDRAAVKRHQDQLHPWDPRGLPEEDWGPSVPA